jgi:uncharacterized protein (DUF1330 family)
MKSYFALGLAMLAGAAFGALAVNSLHAQATPRAYAIIEINEFTNPDLYKTLLPKAPAAMQAFGGQFLVRTEKITPLDGVPPKRFVVVAFDSLDKAKAWSASAAQKEVDAIRQQSTKSTTFLVEGM